MAADRDPSWTDGVRVDERRLQEYLCQKQHTLTLRGAAEVLKHTLQPMPTTDAQDGLVHFGDSLLLRSDQTAGLLQADAVDQVQPEEAAGRPASGASLSTGCALAACPRTVFTLSRVRDDDGFGDSAFVHYGQAFRLGTSHMLQEQPLYLYASRGGGEGLGEDETLACLFPRAPAATHWRAVRAEGGGGESDCVRLGESLQLESVACGRSLRSDSTVRMTSYGNEWRVFCGAGGPDAGSTAAWSFVNSKWAEGKVAEARKASGAEGTLAVIGSSDTPVDPGELLQNPLARAEHDLQVLQTEGGAEVYEVLAHLYPQLRSAGMHVVRRLRRMCAIADVELRGELPLHTFLGHLSYVGIRLSEAERGYLVKLFGTEPGNVDYARFFALMSPSMPNVRTGVVHDAYAKLQGLAVGGLVEADFLQRHWNPGCHPDVQQGKITRSEAMQDFLRQWDIASADGIVSYEVFLDYYKDVSIAVESDDIFVEIVRAGWGL